MLKVHDVLGKECKMPHNEENDYQRRCTERNDWQGRAHVTNPWSKVCTYLICWRDSFWRGLAAGSGLLCSRTAAFPAWLWKNTTLEKKIDFSKFFSIHNGLESGINLVTKGYLSKMQYRLRTWPCSAEVKKHFTTGFTRGAVDLINPIRTFVN